mgnify:CR=1 FL=1
MPHRISRSKITPPLGTRGHHPIPQLGAATLLRFDWKAAAGIGLAIAGTIFATGLESEMPNQLAPVMGKVAASLPAEYQAQFGALAGGLGDTLQHGGGIDLNNLTGVGMSFGQALVAFITTQVPAALQPVVGQVFTPFVGELDHAFYEAFSIAITHVLMVGVVTGLLGIGAAAFMKELPLRKTFGPQTAPAGAGAPGAAPASSAERAPAAD